MVESVAINNTNTTTDTGSSSDDDDVITIHLGNDKESLHTRIEVESNKLIEKTSYIPRLMPCLVVKTV